MDKGKLKFFAAEARRRLISHISARIGFILTNDTAEFIEKVALKEKLRSAWEKAPDREEFIERHAYTLFNRLIALRFMDVRGYNFVPVVTPRVVGGDPGILADARTGLFQPDLPVDTQKISDLLTGNIPTHNPFNEAYKLLFIAACGWYNKQLPFMFEPLNSYTELLLPDDLLSTNSIISYINQNLGVEECENVEVIGWLYQFYISEKKDVLIKRKTRYSTSEIPFVTQLFTPRWMVEYITQNSLGRFWLEARGNSSLRQEMQFFIEPTEGNPFIKREIKSPEEITVIDIACGSGHMLVYAFELLFKMYEEEGYFKSDIPVLILCLNLYGLEIDERAASLAKFALIMKGMEYDNKLLQKKIEPMIYCFRDSDEVPGFENGKTLGSLIAPHTGELEFAVEKREKLVESSNDDLDAITSVLGSKFDILLTNPPYVNSGYFNETTKNFVTKNFKDFGSDLFSVFIVRSFNLVKPDGYLGYVTPFVWMFISSYEKLRKQLIDHKTIVSLVRPSYHAFFESAYVPLCTFVFQNKPVNDADAKYFFLDELGYTDDQVPRLLEGINNPDSKRRFVQKQTNFAKIPGSPIAYWVSERIMNIFNSKKAFLSQLIKAVKGLDTCDNEQFIRLWSEVTFSKTSIGKEKLDSGKWFSYAKGGEARRWYGNYEFVVNWENDGNSIKNLRNADGSIKSRPQNVSYYFQEGATWSSISSARITLRYLTDSIFGGGGSAFFVDDNLMLFIGFINSKLVQFFLNLLNPTMNICVGDLLNLPVHWNEETDDLDEIETFVVSAISISRLDWDSRETSWDFKTPPLLLDYDAETTNPEQGPASRKPGEDLLISQQYEQYKTYWAEKFFQLHRNEEELNRIFIKIYGLEEELTPDVELKDVTILQPEKIITPEDGLDFKQAEVIKQFISWSVGCMFGRYSPDKTGLILANQGETLKDFLDRVPEPSFLPDEDNILPVLDDEYFADDIVARFKKFIETLFGRQHFTTNIRFIEESLGMDIRKYFVKEFHKDHLQRYKKRPIYWLISSPAGSFNALIYMHRYNNQTMSKIFNDYLKEFRSKLISRLKDIQDGIFTGNNPVKEEDRLRKQLKDVEDFILTMTPFAMNPITIDLDDGVKVNIAKFAGVVKGIQ